jgi:subtilase family serine protease
VSGTVRSGQTRGPSGSRRLRQVVGAATVIILVATVGVAGADVRANAAAGGTPNTVGASVRGGPLGVLTPGTELRVDVELRPRNPEALERFATDVSTPGDAGYGHFLARGQFASRFGPTSSALRTVRRWLTGTGASIALSSNHLTVQVRGPASSVERAFQTGIERYRLPGGRIAYANAAAPRIPAGVRPYVEGVVGLNDIALATTAGSAVGAPLVQGSRGATDGPDACTTAVAAAKSKHVYTVAQLASAYDFTGLYDEGDEGSGVTIALFELGPNLPSDLTAFQACFGTHAAVSYVEVDGGAGTGAGDGEAALDIETAIGLAPEAKFEVYQAPHTTTGIVDNFTAMIDDDTAKVISSSWGQCEAKSGATLLDAESTLFQQAATQGQSVFAASGDYGSSDCGTSALAVDDPASQPFVTGVGGTTLSAVGPPPTETTWNDSSIRTGAGGGGVSSLHDMPSYQVDAPASLHVVNADSSGTPCHAAAGSYCREVPDVSADADRSTGYLIYLNGSWSPNGGTSASAPLWAGLMALVDASSTCAGRTIGFANPALYEAAATSYAADFHDITAGDNNYTVYGNSSGLYPATVGYDMATGLGTPIGASLATTLCSIRTTVAVATKTSLHESKTTVTYGSETKETFTVVVTGHSADGRPLGRFHVDNGDRFLCSGTLKRESSTKATGTCRLTAREFAAGRYLDLVAFYAPATPASSDTRVRYTASSSSPAVSITVRS